MAKKTTPNSQSAEKAVSGKFSVPAVSTATADLRSNCLFFQKIHAYELILSMVGRSVFSIVAIVIIFIDLPHLMHAETFFDVVKHGLIELSFGPISLYTWKYWFTSTQSIKSQPESG